MNSLFITLGAGLFILVGIILGNVLKKNKKFIDLSIGLALGVMVLLIFLDILPECFSNLNNNILRVLIYIVVGYLLLKLLDNLVPHHEHESSHHKHDKEECHHEHLEHVGILATIAVVIHNAIEGMTLYTISLDNLNNGILMAIAVGLHNIPLGIMISSTLRNKKELIINSILLTFSAFLGGLILFLFKNNISEVIEGCLLSITVGMIFYIIKDELLPSVINNKDKKYNYIGLIIGIVILLISKLLGGE